MIELCGTISETAYIIADSHLFIVVHGPLNFVLVGISTSRRYRCISFGNFANNCNTYRQDDGSFVVLGSRSHTRGGTSTTPRSTGVDLLRCCHRRSHLRVCSCTLVEAPTQPTADTQHYHRTNVRDMAGLSDETSLWTEGVRHRRCTRTRCNCDRLLRRKHRRFDMRDQLATHEPHHNLRK